MLSMPPTVSEEQLYSESQPEPNESTCIPSGTNPLPSESPVGADGEADGGAGGFACQAAKGYELNPREWQ